jgi:leucyl aminopeptidase
MFKTVKKRILMNFTAQGSVETMLDHDSRVKICFLPKDFTVDSIDPAIVKRAPFDLVAYFATVPFTGKKESMASVAYQDGQKINHLIFVGLGSQDAAGYYSIESLRRGLGSAVKFAKARKSGSISVQMPDHQQFNVAADYLAEQVAVIANMAWYKFDTFISKDTKDAKQDESLSLLVTANKAADLLHVQAGLVKGSIIAQAVNRARTWVDTPASHLTPRDLADHAQKLAAEHNLKCTVFGKDEIVKLGMGGLYGVSRGSDKDPRFVILEYRSSAANAPTLGFVGKGITFDSGGLSLKPAASMEEMKEDMAGAASVINAIVALSQLQPHVNIVAFAALTENMPGPDALKPGDIVTFYNGKTAEVRNTDAEGRLVLADALSYAVKNYQLDGIVDIATLTGACIYAVGPFYSALLSDNDHLATAVAGAGDRAGDLVWRLPFNDDFKRAIESKIADMQNVGSQAIAAGTITAACFLRNFTGDTPWVHLDIASSGYKVPHISYYDGGATGSSIRLLIELGLSYTK